MPALSSSPAPSADVTPVAMPRRTGWSSSSSAASRSRRRRSNSSCRAGACRCIDTPGHKDFSEDTYRALIAADSVVMVIDAANGVEDQTRKLFEVCRRHRLPILTFVNKFDRPSRDPLELMDDVERTLGIAAAPVNWPIGSAERFRGVYDMQHGRSFATSARRRGSTGRRSTSRRWTIRRRGRIDRRTSYAHFRESLDVIREAGTSFDVAEYRAGRQTPVFFGSALDELRPRAVPPGARRARAAAAAAA